MALKKAVREKLLRVKERILAEKLPVIMDNFFSVNSKDIKRWKKYEGDIDPDELYHGIEPEDGMLRIPDAKGKGQFGCNTAGCIAGHALMEFVGGATFEELYNLPSNKKKPFIEKAVWKVEDEDEDYDYEVSFEKLAMKALGLSQDGANKLFYPAYWPDFFEDKYEEYIKGEQFLDANKVVAARIQWFIDFEV